MAWAEDSWETPEFRQQFTLDPVEEGGLAVSADLDDGYMGESGIDILSYGVDMAAVSAPHGTCSAMSSCRTLWEAGAKCFVPGEPAIPPCRR